MKDLAAKAKLAEPQVDSSGSLHVDGYVLDPEEFEILFEGRAGTALAHDRYTMVVLDTAITPELRLEGWAREIVRGVQDLRKKAGYQVEDRIKVSWEVTAPGSGSDDGLPSAFEVFETYGEYISGETLADELTAAAADGADRTAEVKLDGGRTVAIGVTKA